MDVSHLDQRRTPTGWLANLAAASLLISTFPIAAQETTFQIQGQPMSREQAEAMMRARHGAPPPQAAAEQAKPEEKKPEEKKEDDKDKKKEKDTSVKRPKKPPRVPDPRELEVKLDAGRVPPFNFIGQPWPDVLQWLANISNSSLDWQELPDDYLNLTTQRPYTVDEVRDLVNRHLHARGYTMVVGGEVLSVFKIEKIDPSLVPRITEDELYDRKPYDFAKVSFELPEGFEVEKAKEDIKQVLSPTAKVFPLAATKRILVIDAVANLRTVSELLNQERLVQEGRIVPRVFPLKHARAEQVIDVLYVILGLDPKSRPTQMELQLQQKRMEIMAQMQQSGKDVSSLLNKDGPPVYLAYNRQSNSVLVNAPPEYMKIIERAIKELDVPTGGVVDVTQELTAGVGTREFKKYQLATMDPDKLVMTLEEIGGLDPWTELRSDTKSKTLFVQASPADHAKIAGLIDQLDGTGRQFEVIWLRRLPADAMATEIHNLMVGQDEEKEEDDDRGWFWGRNRNEEKEEPPNKGFRVGADIENNRLLLWANEAELTEVRRLLVKLGEIPSGGNDPRPVRFIESGDAAATAQLLERLRSTWSATGKNELIIKLPPKPELPPAKEKEADEEEADKPADDQSAAIRRARLPLHFAQLGAPPAEEPATPAAPAEAAPAPPPITVTVTEDGRLMLSSPDVAALDQLEELMNEISPPEKRFKVFRLEYTTALNMYWNLTDFFKEELADEDGGYIRDWWGFRVPKGKKETASGLGKRRKLQIIYDTPSNTILVANASPSQLREIEQLIAEYDQPAPADSIKTRRTAAIKIRYSKAATIATALKDVYRDLLSSRDREFDTGDKRAQSANNERVTVIRYGETGGGDDGSKRPSPVKVGFEGALSVGVDEIANMLIISVQEELYESVVAMVRQLDEEARPHTTVQVHRVSGTIDPKHLQKALNDALGTPWPGGRPEKAEPAKPAGEKPKPENGKPADEGGENGNDGD